MRGSEDSSAASEEAAAGPRVMTGGQAVVQALARAGVDTVFGMPGVDNLPIYDALLDEPGLRHILVRHEQGAGFMADGYARATRRPGVCVTTTGPGALNAATALGAAYADGSPVLLVASQTEAALIGRGKGPPHDMRDQLGVFRSLVGWARRVERAEEIPAAVHAALRATQGPRPGPAYLEIPSDALAASGAVRVASWRSRRPPKPGDDRVRQAATWLRESRRPALLAGGGIRWSNASRELIELAERLGAPVLTTTAGKGAIPETHPLSFGVTWGRWRAARDLLREADLVMAIGTRLGAVDTASWSLPMPERLIHVDLDAREIGRNYPTGLGLAGDARATLRSLLGALDSNQDGPRHPWLPLGELTGRALSPVRGRAEFQLAHSVLARALPPTATVVNDAPTLGYWMTAYWPAATPGSFLATGFGSLGFGLPAALGVRTGDPHRPVLALCGDGGMLFTSQELATAVHEDLPIVVLLINDQAYGSVKAIQERQYQGRISQVALTNPDFGAYASSFGIETRCLDDPAQLADALAGAFAAERSCLIELRADWDLPPMEDVDDGG